MEKNALGIKKILVTGCLGFIASHFVKKVVFECGEEFTLPENPGAIYHRGVRTVGVSRNTDQKNIRRLEPIIYPESGQVSPEIPHFKLVYADINDANITELLEGVDVVFNFAAKTFVDHSVKDTAPFFESNVLGTYRLLEAVRKNPVKLFVQISTDEVYGANTGEPHTERSPINPTNPYSATKAAADALCMGYAKTYDMPILITRTENNYGKYQHTQKVLPTWTRQALQDKPLQVYGDGKQTRMWLRVEDHCDAIWELASRGCTGIYNIAGGEELQNLELAKIVLEVLGKPLTLIEHIDDSKIRPNHDRRYAINCDKITALGWEPKWDMRGGIENAVKWYETNPWWFI